MFWDPIPVAWSCWNNTDPYYTRSLPDPATKDHNKPMSLYSRVLFLLVIWASSE